MNYVEFNKYEQLEDIENPFSSLFKDEEDLFYIEPIFYTKLKGMFALNGDKKEIILNEMHRLIKKNHKVIFTGDFENPQTLKEGFIILEIEDITNPLKIFVEDKSRGSDYGD